MTSRGPWPAPDFRDDVTRHLWQRTLDVATVRHLLSLPGYAADQAYLEIVKEYFQEQDQDFLIAALEQGEVGAVPAVFSVLERQWPRGGARSRAVAEEILTAAHQAWDRDHPNQPMAHIEPSLSVAGIQHRTFFGVYGGLVHAYTAALASAPDRVGTGGTTALSTVVADFSAFSERLWHAAADAGEILRASRTYQAGDFQDPRVNHALEVGLVTAARRLAALESLDKWGQPGLDRTNSARLVLQAVSSDYLMGVKSVAAAGTGNTAGVQAVFDEASAWLAEKGVVTTDRVPLTSADMRTLAQLDAYAEVLEVPDPRGSSAIEYKGARAAVSAAFTTAVLQVAAVSGPLTVRPGMSGALNPKALVDAVGALARTGIRSGPPEGLGLDDFAVRHRTEIEEAVAGYFGAVAQNPAEAQRALDHKTRNILHAYVDERFTGPRAERMHAELRTLDARDAARARAQDSSSAVTGNSESLRSSPQFGMARHHVVARLKQNALTLAAIGAGAPPGTSLMGAAEDAVLARFVPSAAATAGQEPGLPHDRSRSVAGLPGFGRPPSPSAQREQGVSDGASEPQVREVRGRGPRGHEPPGPGQNYC